eukprot:5232802-Pyramimonas_sp.AAC.1
MQQSPTITNRMQEAWVYSHGGAIKKRGGGAPLQDARVVQVELVEERLDTRKERLRFEKVSAEEPCRVVLGDPLL